MTFRKGLLARLLPAFALVLGIIGASQAITPGQRIILLGGCPPSLRLNGGTCAPIALNFAQNIGQGANGIVQKATSLVTVTRAQASAYVTNLLATSPSGFAYLTFAANTLVRTPGLGALIFESRTNYLLNSTAPVTQTTGVLADGTYTLWVNGSGSATLSLGTGTGCTTQSATQGTPVSFTITLVGTCVITVSGSLNFFQLELNPGSVSAPTSGIITAGATQARAADVVTLTSPPVFGSAYTLYASGVPLTPTSYGTNQYLVGADDGSNQNRFAIFRASGSGDSASVVTAQGTFVTGLGGGVMAANTLAKVSMSYTSGAQITAQNGQIFTGTATGSPSAFTQVSIGKQFNSGSFANGYIERIALWPQQALPATTLRTITSGSGGFIFEQDIPANDNFPAWFEEGSMNLILDYDASCDSAPAGFERALNNLALIFDDTFTTDATVTIAVGFGEIGGAAIPPFVLGESNTTFNTIPDAASPNGLLEVPSDVGQVGFTDIPYLHYDAATKTPASQYDFRGVAEHEITEVMGRQLLLGDPGYTALDLLRYSAPGVHDYSPTFGGYASANGGATILNGFNVNPYGDPGDWQGATNDAFNAYTNPGVRNPMSANDLAVMNAIGWTNGGVIENELAHHHI